MLLDKNINRYYLKYAGWLVLGLAALMMVDYFQLEIPKLYRLIINGMNGGKVEADGVHIAFDVDFLLDEATANIDTETELLIQGDWRIGESSRESLAKICFA